MHQEGRRDASIFGDSSADGHPLLRHSQGLSSSRTKEVLHREPEEGSRLAVEFDDYVGAHCGALLLAANRLVQPVRRPFSGWEGARLSATTPDQAWSGRPPLRWWAVVMAPLAVASGCAPACRRVPGERIAQ
jgi:hypothetical protein